MVRGLWQSSPNSATIKPRALCYSKTPPMPMPINEPSVSNMSNCVPEMCKDLSSSQTRSVKDSLDVASSSSLRTLELQDLGLPAAITHKSRARHALVRRLYSDQGLRLAAKPTIPCRVSLKRHMGGHARICKAVYQTQGP